MKAVNIKDDNEDHRHIPSPHWQLHHGDEWVKISYCFDFWKVKLIWIIQNHWQLHCRYKWVSFSMFSQRSMREGLTNAGRTSKNNKIWYYKVGFFKQGLIRWWSSELLETESCTILKLVSWIMTRQSRAEAGQGRGSNQSDGRRSAQDWSRYGLPPGESHHPCHFI